MKTTAMRMPPSPTTMTTKMKSYDLITLCCCVIGVCTIPVVANAPNHHPQQQRSHEGEEKEFLLPAVAVTRSTAALAAAPTKTATSTGTIDNNDGGVIILEDFASPQHQWVEMNDPVMGGSSTGEFKIDEDSGVANFHGNVEIVSFLKAPGFIKVETTKPSSTTQDWPDVSSCDGISITMRNNLPYEGLKLSFGKTRPPHAFPYIYGYKTNLTVDDDDDDDGFEEYKLQFEEFTDNWDAGSGNPIVTCHDDERYCPDKATKESLYSLALWGEGVEGSVDIDIKQIAAYGCSSSTSQMIVDDDDNDGQEEEDDGSNEIQVLDVDGAPDAALLSDDEIVIEDFTEPVNKWTNLNDPVMGGRSHSSVKIEDGIAHFSGKCTIVPFLKAPGFITMVTGGWLQKAGIFPDVSSCHSLKLVLKSNVDYDGYRVSFGKVRVPGGGHASGYKAPALTDIPHDAFGEIVIPFSDFSSKWDEKTGDVLVKCRDDPQFCPKPEWLRNMKTMSFWGEGVEGEVDLEIKRISAVGCGSATPIIDSDASVVELQAAQQSIVRSEHLSADHSVKGAGLMGFFIISAGVLVAAFHQRRRRSRTQSYTQIRGSIEDGMDVVEL